MFKLVLEKAKEPQNKLPTPTGSLKKQENFRRTSASLTNLKSLTVWITANCGKFLKRWEYQTTLSASCRICMPVKMQQLELDSWFKIRKGVFQGCILLPCLFNLYAEYIMWNAGLDDAQVGIKIVGKSINNLRYAYDTTLMAESEKLKSLLMKVKEESEKADLKLNIKKTRIMAIGSITSWQTEGKKVEAVTDFIFFDLKIIMGSDCSHEIKRPLLLGRKAMPNLNSILKKIQRHHFADRGLYSQRCGFSRSHVWMWELDHKEGWALKNWCLLLGLQEDQISQS